MKKGFTLIELLAVIVILALVALIATPIVLNIINGAKESARERTAENYLRAVENAYAASVLNKTYIADGRYTIMGDGNICIGTVTSNTCSGTILKVEVNGTRPSSGTVTLIKGKIDKYSLIIDGKMIKTKVCFLTDSNSNKIGDIGEKIKCGTESFYIYSNTGSEYKLLSEFNLNVGDYKVSGATEGLQNENAKGYYSAGSSPYKGAVPFSNSNGWASSVDIDVQSYDGPAKTAINNYKNVLEDIGVTLKDISLITKHEIEILVNDGKTMSNGALPTTYPWLYSTTYWTATSDDAYHVWHVNTSGDYQHNNYYVNNIRGVRPIIVISKDEI